MKYEALFSPIKLRGLELKNRIFLPAMMTKMATVPDGQVTQALIDYHVARAKGGCGLNVTECCAIHESTHGLGYLALYTEEHKAGIKRLIDAVHEVGGKVCVQIWHGGQVPRALLPDYRKPMLTNEMSKEDIDMIVECYGKSTKMAVEAGADAIEYHTAHTYLPHTFLSAIYNERTDEYNGSLENRARFSMEVIRKMRENMPEDMPLLMRMNSCDDHHKPNGLTVEDMTAFANMAIKEGVDLIDVSRGNGDSAGLKYEVPSIDVPQGYNIENASKIREGVSVPVSVAGRVNYPELANKFIAEGKIDMIAIGRAQIADPEFCNKAMRGEDDLIRRCVGCNQGCFDAIMDPKFPTITCMRNPFVGEEGKEIPKAEKSKRVLIAGGGMAGLTAANVLKMRGHEPMLYEASDHLGGQFILAGKAPTKREIEAAAHWEGEEAKRRGVEIHLNTPVTPQLIEEVKPDEVILAIGAVPLVPTFAGGNQANVTNAHDVLGGVTKPTGKVVIVGGGLVGLEVAEFLGEQGADCTVIEVGPAVGANLGWIRKMCVHETLARLGVKCLTKATCKGMTETGVIYEQDGENKSIECDYVVIAIGARPRPFQDLHIKCNEMGIPCHVIGDTLKARVALTAVAEGKRTAMLI